MYDKCEREVFENMLGQLAVLREIFHQELSTERQDYHWDVSWKMSQLEEILKDELDTPKEGML